LAKDLAARLGYAASAGESFSPLILAAFTALVAEAMARVCNRCAGDPRGPGQHDIATCDAAAIRDFCTGRLAHYKIPRYVHVVDEFPMTVTGKVRKAEMRELAGEILG